MRVTILLFTFLLPLPVLADNACHDLWFTRNQIMDRAGYCFGSVLGQTLFDNRDCQGKNVSLSAADRRVVDEIRRLEKRIGCRVNTGQSYIDLDDIHTRYQLVNLPVLDELQSACLGWLGPVTVLRAGHSAATAPIGQIQPGDYVSYSHLPVGSWTYVTAETPDWRVKSAGWLDLSATPEQCREIAG